MRGLLAYKPVVTVRNDNATNPITDAAWAQIVAALGKPASAVEIYNPSGVTMRISTGAAGLEDASELPYSILPGGSSILMPMDGIRNGARISLKAVDAGANVNTNILVLNFLG